MNDFQICQILDRKWGRCLEACESVYSTMNNYSNSRFLLLHLLGTQLYIDIPSSVAASNRSQFSHWRFYGNIQCLISFLYLNYYTDTIKIVPLKVCSKIVLNVQITSFYIQLNTSLFFIFTLFVENWSLMMRPAGRCGPQALLSWKPLVYNTSITTIQLS